MRRSWFFIIASVVLVTGLFLAGCNVNKSEDTPSDNNNESSINGTMEWAINRTSGQVWALNGALVPLDGVIASVRGSDWTVGMTVNEVNAAIQAGDVTLPAGAVIRPYQGTGVAEIVINNAIYVVAARDKPGGQIGFLPSTTVRGVFFQATPAPVAAGDDPNLNLEFESSTADWDLSTVLPVDRFGFQFAYPNGWFVSANPGNVTLAANEADLALETDGDLATTPTTPTISLNAIPLQNLNIDPNATFAQIRDYVLTLGGIQVAEIYEIPVMLRKSVTFAGLGQDGRQGLATAWRQGDFLMLFTLNTPDAKTLSDLAFSWGNILGSMQPIPAPDLAPATEVTAAGVRLQYPAAWQITPDAETFTVADAASGASISLFVAPVSDFTSTTGATVDSLSEVVLSNLGVTQVVNRAEFVFFEAPALSLLGSTPDGVWLNVFYSVRGDQVFFMIHTAPTLEAVANFEPTWIAMLQSIQLLQ